MDFYGEEADQYTMDFIKSQPASSGLYAVTSSGVMITDSSGNPILTSKGSELKRGKSSGAMGSGDRSGIMTSIPISQPMYKSQQKTKAILLGGLSLATSGFTAMGMRTAAFDAINKSGQAGYSKYLSKFYTSQGKDVSSSGVKSGNVDTSGTEVSSAGIINTSVTDNQNVDVAGTFKKKKAGQGADQIASDRSLFATTNRTITGSMTA